MNFRRSERKKIHIYIIHNITAEEIDEEGDQEMKNVAQGTSREHQSLNGAGLK